MCARAALSQRRRTKISGPLTTLAERKAEIDFHYAAQALMKRWLLLHLPLAAAVVLLALWHILLVHIYAL